MSAEQFKVKFEELRPYLEQLFNSVQPGTLIPKSSSVFRMVGSPVINLGTALQRMIKKAGLTPWPKLFNNMRSSRETELFKQFQPVDVCRWFGYSPAVAARYYAQATATEALHATQICTIEGAKPTQSLGAPAGARTMKWVL